MLSHLDPRSPCGPTKYHNLCVLHQVGEINAEYISDFSAPSALVEYRWEQEKFPLPYFLLHSIFQNALSRVSWNIYVIPPFPQDFCIRIFETRRYWRANIAGNQYLGALFPIWLKIDRLARLRDFQSMLALSLLRQQAFDQIALLVSWFQIPVNFVRQEREREKVKKEK